MMLLGTCLVALTWIFDKVFCTMNSNLLDVSAVGSLLMPALYGCLLLPVLGLAVIDTKARRYAGFSYRPVALFLLLFLLMTVLFLDANGMLGLHGGLNWFGYTLSFISGFLLVVSMDGSGFEKIGFGFSAEDGNTRSNWFFVLRLYFFVFGYLFLFSALGSFIAARSGAHVIHHHIGVGLLLFELMMPGVVEEFFFRGIFLYLLDRAFGRPWQFMRVKMGWGAVIVSFLFGLMHSVFLSGNALPVGHLGLHVSLWVFLITAGWGFFFAWIKERTGNLMFCILGHDLVNMLTLFTMS